MTKIAAIFSLLLLMFFSLTSVVDANKEMSLEMEGKQITSSAAIKYDLAFPGILPDHPLYKLKVLRDRVSTSLISDPQKKINFYLLQADKGILAAAMLIDKNKIELAKETTLKAENNMTLLTYGLGNLPNKANDSLFARLKTASLKHQEVLKSILNRVPEKDKKQLQTVIDFSKRNWKTIEDFQKSIGLPQK